MGRLLLLLLLFPSPSPHVFWQTAIVKVTVIKAALVRWLLCKAVMMWANKGRDAQVRQAPSVLFIGPSACCKVSLPHFMTVPAAASVLHPSALFCGLKESTVACGWGVRLCVCTRCVCVNVTYHAGIFSFIYSIYFCPSVSLSARRRVFVLAAALWQYVLPPRSSASLYDPADDEWRFESEGKLAGVHAAQIWTILKYSSRCFGIFPDLFQMCPPPLLCYLPSHISISSLCIPLLYLAAVRRWPSELDKGVRRSQRNKPFLLPPARRCGG